MVSCAKICRNIGIVSNIDYEDKNFIYENIDAEVLENAIVSDEEQVYLFLSFIAFFLFEILFYRLD